MKYQRNARTLAKRIGTFIMMQIAAYSLVTFCFCGYLENNPFPDWTWAIIVFMFALPIQILSIMFWVELKKKKIKSAYIKAIKTKNRRQMHLLEMDAMWLDAFIDTLRDYCPVCI